MTKLTLLGAPLSDSFRLSVTVVAAGEACAYDAREWDDALVVVEHGEIELVCDDGTSALFGAGAVLTLAGLPLRALHNRGRDPAVIASVSRAGARTYSESNEGGS